MFGYEEFLAKARLYFERAEEADDRPDEHALWLLLGLEFVLRAPLARVHPTLLALPEGDSILLAAGLELPRSVARSIPVKSVISRLTKIDPNFGEDRGKQAVFLTELRNEELHSSSAELTNIGPNGWMPAFIDVVEAVCTHLDLSPNTLLPTSILQAAEEYRATADAKTQGLVRQASKGALALYEGLTSTEIAARKELSPPSAGAQRITCPVCNELGAWLVLTAARTTEPTYDDENQQIRYKEVRVVSSLHCNVCGLSLATPAQVIAAGVKRLHVEDYVQDRYEGWEELMTYEDALEFLGAGEDYGNE